MIKNINPYSVAYILACLMSLFFIDANASVIEMILKIMALTFLSFFYLSSSKKINYFYLIILMSSITSDTFLIFDDDFMMLGVVLLLINRVLYLIILKKEIQKENYKLLFTYLIPSSFLFFIVVFLLKPYLKELSYFFFIICFLNALMVGVSFFIYLNKMTKKNLFFLLGLSLIIIADFFIAFNKFIDYKLVYVIIYTVMYYIARYLICESMIKEINR